METFMLHVGYAKSVVSLVVVCVSLWQRMKNNHVAH
jgi:hypothetical protein